MDMSTEQKAFDVGIYSFKRKVSGFMCPPDDMKCKDGEIFGVIHPILKVEYKGLYCFGVSRASLDTKTLVRNNLKFVAVRTLHYIKTMSAPEDTQAKLNAIVDFLKAEKEREQLILIQEQASGEGHQGTPQ
jgi:hypothetical protein